ncbi:MAG TPA: enoyl-CoA hydratase/isomerase family protein [Actinomycetota bacterium]|nr:enoyl-CoA hydratase/isomerase family protein [Actinomycetota bacterium]
MGAGKGDRVIDTPVDIRVRDRVAFLTLSRPEARNAIDEAMLEALPPALRRVRDDPDVKALVITGAGDAFCIGLDIDLLERAFDDPEYFRDVLERFKRILGDIEALPVPVVAAANGLTRAGGFELMLSCDLAVVAAEARIADHHLAFGIVPGGGSTQRLPRKIGEQRAREIIFTGRWLTGDEAAHYGLALHAAPLTRLGDAVEDVVAPLRHRSRTALAATKAAMNEGASLPLVQALGVETDVFMRYLTNDPHAAEGFRAYREGRDPQWP